MAQTVARLMLIGVAVLATVALAQAETLKDGVRSYKPHLIERIAQAIAGARELQAAVHAHDLAAAQAAWIRSRKGWEAMRPVTATYFADLDELIDAGPDGKTGYPVIEGVLFSASKTEGLAKPVAELLTHLEQFEKRVLRPKFTITSQKLLEGAANLAADAGKRKPVDVQDNVAGIALAWNSAFAGALKDKDAALAGVIDERIQNLKNLVADADRLDTGKVQAAGEELASSMLKAVPALDLKPFEVENDDEDDSD